MNLEFKILWFDDNWGSDLKGYVRNMKRYLRDSEGFECKIEESSGATGSQIESLADSLNVYNEYDLIILDYDLKRTVGSLDGHELAKVLREKIATDLVLYSSDGVEKLRQALCDKGVDAVSVINRAKFDADIASLLSKQIKRTFDMDNLRGFVLQQLAEIEVEMRRKLTLDVLPNLQEEQQESVNKKLKNSLIKKTERAKKLSDNAPHCIEGYKDYSTTDFNAVRTRLASLEKIEELLNGNQAESFQKNRNYLAHEPSRFDEDSGKLIIEISGQDNLEFNYDKFRELRILALEIREALNI